MIARARRLFQKYLRQHLAATARGVPLKDPGGALLGYVDEVRYQAGRVHVTGWCVAGRLALVAAGSVKPVHRTVQRPDVAQARPDLVAHSGPQVGFAADLMWSGGPVSLAIRLPATADAGARDLHVPLPLPDARVLRAGRQRALRRFAVTALRVGSGVAIDMARGRDPDVGLLRRRFGLGAGAGVLSRTIGDGLFATAPPAVPATDGITIVLPVYNAFDLLPQTLRRVDAHTDLPWHLIAVEDRSTDPAVRPWLRDWAAARPDRVTLVENDINLGFIGSVNRALALAPAGRPVVLLNSDALVPADWASRLVGPILSDPGVASVTPMSNDATIFSVPDIALSRAIAEGQADRIDATARTLNPLLAAEAPTGVGFCMALSPAALAAVPQLDPVFGKGYGEEVDWCQRTRALGMRHVGIPNLFVEHRGGQSFGNEVKAAAMLASGRIITSRYPHFDLDVQEFIAADPLADARLALGLAWAAGAAPDDRVSVYVGHSLGGGAESWLAGAIAADLEGGRPAVVLRLGGPVRFGIELHSDAGVTRGATDSAAVLARLLAPLAGQRVVYSCGVGDPAGIEIPGLLLRLAGADAEIRVLFHDYWPVSPSYTLVDADGVFRGVPLPGRADPAHRARTVGGDEVTLAAWQAAWGRLVAAARQVVVFSHDSARIVRAVWPDAPLAVHPHSLAIPDLAVDTGDWGADRPGTIAVLGAIGVHKGAEYVCQVAADFARRPGAPRLIVIGEFDMAFPLPGSVAVTGRYHVEDLPALIRRHRVQAWLMPSIVPETFSFTTHEMLATGLPVMAFDLGAQGDAVAQAPRGHILPDRRPDTLLATFLQATRGPADRATGQDGGSSDSTSDIRSR
ncbi:glycosyltransferase [Paracoccus luteus]|uniref:glycosyltransferase n=1 Tax=Paracoccus luteus TaxID=2508543 RepID=UPI00106F4F9F|nr:glycosyltransferase [Paracoccus luteus]